MMFNPKKKQCRSIQFDVGAVCYGAPQQAASLKGQLLYPSKESNNPNIVAAQQASVAWASNVGLANSDLIKKKLNAANFAGLFSTSLRHSSVFDLQIMADFCVFLFVLDDLLDEKDLKFDKELLQQVFDVFYNIFNGKYQSFDEIPKLNWNFPLYDGFCRACWNIRRRLETIGLDLSYFAKSVDRHLRGASWGSTGGFRNISKTFTVSRESYLLMRRFTGAVKPVIELSYILNRLSLPFELRKDPVVRRMHAAANHIICILNDIVSLKKEIKEGNTENIIITECRRLMALGKDKPLERAIRHAIKLHNSEVAAFIYWKKFLPTKDPACQRFYTILTDCINDNQRWSFESTKRYGLTLLKHEEVTCSLEELVALMHPNDGNAKTVGNAQNEMRAKL